MPIRRMAIAVVVLCLSSTATARAEGSRASRFAEARRACASGQLERGIQLLADLIAEKNDAAAVYHQARCYQDNGRPEQALARFKEFLRLSPNLSPRGRDEVNVFVGRLEFELEDKARRESPVRVATPPRDLVARSGYWRLPTRRQLTVAAAAVGAAALASSVYFGLRAHSIERDIERQNRFAPVADTEYQRRFRLGKSAETWQVVTTVVAALTLGQAAVLYFLDRRSSAEATSLAVARF